MVVAAANKKRIIVYITFAWKSSLNVRVGYHRVTTTFDEDLTGEISPQNAIGEGWGGVPAKDSAAVFGGRVVTDDAVDNGGGGSVAVNSGAAPFGRRIACYRAVCDGGGRVVIAVDRAVPGIPVFDSKSRNHRVLPLTHSTVKGIPDTFTVDDAVLRSVLRLNGYRFTSEVQILVAFSSVSSISNQDCIGVRCRVFSGLDRWVVVWNADYGSEGGTTRHAFFRL